MVLLFGWKASQDYSMFVRFIDGAIHHTQNLISTVWVIYSPIGQLIASRSVFLGPYTNSVVEYSVVVELLHDTIMH
jgi:hypothetical protein